MIVLGLNPGVDSSAALLVDGRIGAAVSEERLSRKKLHLGFPRRGIREVLRLSGVAPGQVDCVTFSFTDYLTAHPAVTRFLLRDDGFPFDPENPLGPGEVLSALLKAAKPGDFFPPTFGAASERNRERNERAYLDALRELGIEVDGLYPVDHHLSHAASAFYTSGFDDALILTSDGCGDGLSLSVSRGRGSEITRLRAGPEAGSAGMFYASVTAYLGFKAHRHEGKITGLAALGDPTVCYAAFEPCFRVADDGRTLTNDFVNPSTLEKLAHLGRLFRGRWFRKSVMNAYDEHYRRHLAGESKEDIAAAAQQRFEDVFLDYVRPIVAEEGTSKLALAGGTFANVKLNQRLLALEGVEEVFIHPNMGDGGNALGSAMLAHLDLAGATDGEASEVPPAWRIDDVYLGAGFEDEEIEAELRRRGLPFERCENIEAAIAERVADYRIVGRFNGRMEYGPRALGNRTIMAHPQDRTVNDTLNARLRRTEFMPFAPSVLEEDALEYFDLDDGALRAAEYMT
ncbi:MAG: carbamoyltransferase N-terminal domain-containing protein, partial [Gemmatimonadota bacterium]|nr:carbamoyltransferase N-terminal domain-containing protein [Gemmatimonadota bacterium]